MNFSWDRKGTHLSVVNTLPEHPPDPPGPQILVSKPVFCQIIDTCQVQFTTREIWLHRLEEIPKKMVKKPKEMETKYWRYMRSSGKSNPQESKVLWESQIPKKARSSLQPP